MSRLRVGRLFCAMGLALGACVSGSAPPAVSGIADDGRAGVVTDLQGTVLVRPAGRQRWSPVGPRTVLLPGDDLRTVARGANAAEVHLAGGGSLVLGPDSQARLESRARVRLVRGDAEVAGTAGHAVAVAGPGGFDAPIEQATVVRAGDASTQTLTTAPRWLTGYRGSTTDEWMGSLLAKVDGRNVPLTVGYHKVKVAIRDQIAETIVEESFVNSTAATLEGVFTFPLPAGASISGFGMWVGEELVEADIVERERARAIYEDIKARRKDPGLLEWAGGNLFTASVFPILPHSEKRVRVRYTQVLPLEGRLLRYRYALRSELLRTSPLRELRIEVTAQSSAPLASVSSPTHETQVTNTGHEAVIGFAASEVTPDRDFEVDFALAPSAPLRVLPHRRGEDGYFMLLLAPPESASGAPSRAAPGGWKRDLVPDGAPIDLLFVADTSGSMGPADRGAQRRFLESALTLLGPDDRFRLMACDAGVAWIAADPTPATPENVAHALDALDARWSLGWTDLDQAFASAAERASGDTRIVYVGDGIGTTGDADPVALAQRIGGLAIPEGATFHAVATGSTYEQGVMEAIAARGGTFRATGDDPARAATSLLTEIAQPAVKDLKVAFEGFRTARVYPERLPNLPAGTEQIVLGRFLPEGGAAQRGRAIVTGTLAGKPVRYECDIVVPQDEIGNSFLPRLWARRHLDALLAAGRTPAIRDEVVAFSERFGIITPYTSFLVLENDTDREQYGVTRRVAMRDGERFFADTRTAAQTAALREQMRAAQSWRLGLRRRVLAEIADLGRRQYPQIGYAYGVGGWGVEGGHWGTGSPSAYGVGRSGGGGSRGPTTGGVRSSIGRDEAGGDGASYDDWTIATYQSGAFEDAGVALRETLSDAKLSERNEMDFGFDSDASYGGPLGEVPPDSREPSDPPPPDGWEFAEEGAPRAAYEAVASRKSPWTGPVGRGATGRLDDFRARTENVFDRGLASMNWFGQELFGRFPALADPPPALPAPAATAWDAEVASLLASLAIPDGTPAPGVRLEISWRDGTLGFGAPPVWPTGAGRALAAPDRWFVRTEQEGTEPIDQWLSPGDGAADRGALATGTRLGRHRPGTDRDRAGWLGQAGLLRADYARGYATWGAKLESRSGAIAVVRFTAPGEGNVVSQRVTIDTEKHVVTKVEALEGEKVTNVRVSSGFVLAGGVWWPTEESNVTGDGKQSWRRALTAREVPAAEFDPAFATATGGHDDVIFLAASDPTLASAKQQVHDQHGTFADFLTVAAQHASLQRWDAEWTSWEAAKALVPGKPGADWIEATILSRSRRGEQFAAHLRTMADRVAKDTRPVAHALARLVDTVAQSSGHAGEQRTLLDTLERAGVAGTPDDVVRWRSVFWRQRRALCLAQLGRTAESTAIRRALWEERRDDLALANELMTALVSAHDTDAALDLLAHLDLEHAGPLVWQVQQIVSQVTNLLWESGRWDTMLQVAERWIALQPAQPGPYQDRQSAVLALGRIEEFDAWIAAQIDAPAATPPDAAAASARLQAAVNLALGDDRSGRWWGSSMDPKWVRPLALLARRISREESGNGSLAARIAQDHRFAQTDGHRELLDWIRADLAAPGGVETPSPGRLAQSLALVPWNRRSVDAALWRDVTNRAEARLRSTQKSQDRDTLGRSVLMLLDQHEEPDEAIGIARELLARASDVTAPAENAAAYAQDLFNRLLRGDWSQAHEDEAWALVPRLVPAKAEKPARRWTYATVSRWLVGRLSALRQEAGLGPRAAREKLPRAELRAKTASVRDDVRRALATHLAAEGRTADADLRPWYEIERLCLTAELGDDAAAVEADAREMLLSIAARRTTNAGDDAADDDDRLSSLLRERSVLALTLVSVRKSAPEGLTDRTAALLTERLASDEKALDWRWAIFRLDVALDRTEALEAGLRSWTVPGQVESRWRVALAYLLAEKGRLQEAVAQFEEVATLDELREADYARLADWYLVLGDDAGRARSRDRRWVHVDEWALQQRVWRERQRVTSRERDGVPPGMDDEILDVIRALLAKSTDPQGHVYVVHSLYQATKDVRLLASLADGVVGHTPEGTYPFLTTAWDVVNDVHEEATCDELRERLLARLPSARTDTDRRALTLLMAQVERRAAEVLDQPGPHVEKALESLRTARQGDWLPSERRLMADYLASLGKMPFPALGDEQVAQLRDLLAGEKTGTEDRFRIAFALARTDWVHGRADPAIDGLGAALDEHRAAQGGLLPPQANDVVDTFTGWQEARKRFAAAETWLLAEAGRQTERTQKEWYARRTFQSYVSCLGAGETVSLGKGEALYVTVRGVMEKALMEQQPDHLDDLLGIYCDLHGRAHRAAKLKQAGDDLVRFSQTLLVELLPRFGSNAVNEVGRVADTILDVAGPIPAMTLLVEHVEREPDWRAARRSGYGAWGNFGWRLQEWRLKAGPLGALEPRLLAIVLRELERDLTTEQNQGRALYGSKAQRGFWAEKAGDFAVVARRVVAEHPTAAGILRHAAEYLWGGLELRDEAIRVLEEADLRSALREDGRWDLVRWHQERKEWKESLPHAERLVKDWPDNWRYALANVRALHGVARDPDGLALADATRAHFDELIAKNGLPGYQGVRTEIADTCLDCGYLDRAESLYVQAISERRRATRGGRGDGELSRLYGALGRVQAGLGRHDEAVETASAGVVAWGPSQGNRDQALQALRTVLEAIPDLPAWTAKWEAAAEADGTDAPVIRLALARIHLDREEYGTAIRQLLVARRMQPDDATVHADLVRAYKKSKDAAGECEALAVSLFHLPRQLDLYPRLAKALTGLGRAGDAERALTGMVEFAPNEAEGHRALAGQRREARRFGDAAEQWRQVVRILSSDFDAHLDLARDLAAADRKDEALAALDALAARKWSPAQGKKIAQVRREIETAAKPAPSPKKKPKLK